MNPYLNASLNYAHEKFQDFVDELSELLRIKTVSADSAYSNEMQIGAQWLVDYLKTLGSD